MRVIDTNANEIHEATTAVVARSTAVQEHQTRSGLSDSQTEIVDLATSEVLSAVEQLKVFVNKCIR